MTQWDIFSALIGPFAVWLLYLLWLILQAMREQTREQVKTRQAIEHFHNVWYEYGPNGRDNKRSY